MGTVNSGIALAITVTTGTTVVFQDEEWDYRYYQVIAADPNNTEAFATINGQPMSFTSAYSVSVDMPIWSIEVTGGSVVLMGVKTPRFLFGKYGSSSEGLV